MAYTVAGETTGVSYQWCAGKTLSYNTESRMPEALQVALPRTSIFSTTEARRTRPSIVIKGGYVKNKNSKRCLMMAGKIFRRAAGAASKAGGQENLTIKCSVTLGV